MRQCISIKRTICPELDPSQTKLPNHHASVSVIWTRSFAPQRRLQSARLISSDFQRFQNISNISRSFSCNETGTWNFCTVWDQEPDDFVHGNLGVDLRVSWAAFLLAQWCLKWFRGRLMAPVLKYNDSITEILCNSSIIYYTITTLYITILHYMTATTSCLQVHPSTTLHWTTGWLMHMTMLTQPHNPNNRNKQSQTCKVRSNCGIHFRWNCPSMSAFHTYLITVPESQMLSIWRDLAY